MASDLKSDIKYLPQHCQFLRQEVWAILKEQQDHSCRVVNCLDKAEACYTRPCVFTTNGGEWPFSSTTTLSPVI